MSIPDLDLLVLRTAASDHEAFTDLYDATAPRLFGLALELLREQALSMDVAASTYAEIWRTSRDFDPVRQGALDWMTAILHAVAATFVGLDAIPARAVCAHGPTRRRAAPRSAVSGGPCGSTRGTPSRCAARSRRSR